MHKIASRELATALKRALRQNSAPSTPLAYSNAASVNTAHAADKSALSSNVLLPLRIVISTQSASRGFVTNIKWAAPAFSIAARNGMPIGIGIRATIIKSRGMGL